MKDVFPHPNLGGVLVNFLWIFPCFGLYLGDRRASILCDMEHLFVYTTLWNL